MSQQAQPRGPHISQLLSAYLDNQLNPAERARVQVHLATCPACTAELSELQATVGLLARLPAVPLPRSFVLAEAPARPPLLDRLLGPAWGYGALRLATVVATLLLVVLVSGDLFTQYLAPRAAMPAPTPAPLVMLRQPLETLPTGAPEALPPAPQAVAPTRPPAPAPLAAGSPAPVEVPKAQPTPLPTKVPPTRTALPTSTPSKPADVGVASRAPVTATPPPTTVSPLATPTPLATATPTPRPPTPTLTLSPTPPPPTPTVTLSPTPLPPTPTAARLEAGGPQAPQPAAAPAAPVRGMGELAGLPLLRWAEFGLAGLLVLLLVVTLVTRRRR